MTTALYVGAAFGALVSPGLVALVCDWLRWK